MVATITIDVALVSNPSITVQKVITVNIVKIACNEFRALTEAVSPKYTQYNSDNPIVLKSFEESNFLTWQSMDEIITTNYYDDCGDIVVRWY